MRPVFLKTSNNVIVNASNVFSFNIEKVEHYFTTGMQSTYVLYANGPTVSEVLVETDDANLANRLIINIMRAISNPNSSAPIHLMDLGKYDINFKAKEGHENGGK